MTDVLAGRAQAYLIKRFYDIIQHSDGEQTMTLRLLSTLGTPEETDGGTLASGSGYANVTTTSADWGSASQPPLSLTTPGLANTRTFTFGPGTTPGLTFQAIALFHGSVCVMVWETSGSMAIGDVVTIVPGALRINIADQDYYYVAV